jgi:hypothetical protein
MIDLYWEILRTTACSGVVVNRIAGALSEPTPVEDVIVPLHDLMAAGLIERFTGRSRSGGTYRYRLTDLGEATYLRMLRLDRQISSIEARLQVPAFVRVCPAHAL